MAKNPYDDLSIKGLGQIYNLTKSNKDKIEGALLEEINRRGGEEKFTELLRREQFLDIEKARISKEMAGIMGSQSDPEFAKKLISSELMSQDELSEYIDNVSRQLNAQKFNNAIDVATITKSLMGMLIATSIGAVIAAAQLLLLGSFIYLSLIIIFIVSLLCICLTTKKNAGNIIVFLCAIASTILGPLIAFVFFSN